MIRLRALLTVFALISCSLPVWAEPPVDPVETFSKAKKLARDEVYADRKLTFYCRCGFTPKGRSSGTIDPSDCGFTPKSNESRAEGLEWEHVVPASRLARHLSCWTDGHDLCVEADGDTYKGRRCCEKRGIDDDARHMINDLHNLVPSIGEVNGDRFNFPYGIVEGDADDYGTCDMEVGGSPKRAEPTEALRGNAARISLYMNETYELNFSSEEINMFNEWSAAIRWERGNVNEIDELNRYKVIRIRLC